MIKASPNIVLTYTLIACVISSGIVSQVTTPPPKPREGYEVKSNINQFSGGLGYQLNLDAAQMAQNELKYLMHEIMNDQVGPDPEIDKIIVDNLWDLYDHSYLG